MGCNFIGFVFSIGVHPVKLMISKGSSILSLDFNQI